MSPKSILSILIFIILAFSISWPINKMGLQYMTPITFAALRLLTATICAFLITIITRTFIWPTRKDWPLILTLGVFQIGLFALLVNLGLELVHAGRSAILVYTTPIWVTPLAVIFFKEAFGLLKIIGLICGIIGIVLLFGPTQINWENQQEIISNIILLLAAFSWAISILCARYMRWPHSPISLFPWQLLIGTIPVLLASVYEYPHTTIVWNTTLVSSILFVGIFAQCMGALGAIIVSKALPTTTTSLSFLAVPVLGIIFSHLILDESITIMSGVALIFIIIGLACTALEQKYSNKNKYGQNISPT